jgi:hypothetical protein
MTTPGRLALGVCGRSAARDTSPAPAVLRPSTMYPAGHGGLQLPRPPVTRRRDRRRRRGDAIGEGALSKAWASTPRLPAARSDDHVRATADGRVPAEARREHAARPGGRTPFRDAPPAIPPLGVPIASAAA